MRDREHDESVPGPDESPSPGPPPEDDLALQDWARDLEQGAGSGQDATPPPDDELIIVRDLGDQLALEPAPVPLPPPPPARPPEPPAGPDAAPDPAGAEVPPEAPAPGRAPVDPPREEPREEARPDPKPASTALGVDWDRELRTSGAFRRPPPSATRAPAGAPARARLRAAAEKRKASPAAPPEPGLRALRTVAIAGGGVFAVATAFMLLRVEPFTTWYYLFAWYPFLLGVNYATARRSPDRSLLRRPARPTLLLFFWSVPVWLFFEVWNFRLGNWYYVGVPADLLARRIGVVASFATVLPGIFLLEEWLGARRLFTGLRSPSFRLTRGLGEIFLVSGAIWGLFLLWLPDVFFPLLWGVPVLLLEPWLWRGPGPSLARELSEGRPGRILRLLIAGLGAGLFWESMNFLAGGKWIYTVPGLETSKLFEMPVVGFVGFAPFALSCWVMARALVRLGLLPEWDVGLRAAPVGSRTLGDRSRTGAWAAALLGSALVLALMDRWTVDSFAPRPEDIPNIPDGIVEYAREHGRGDVSGILEMAEAGAFDVPGESGHRAIEDLADASRLVLLRGLGTGNTRRLLRVGVRSVEDLARQDPARLAAALAELDEPGWRPRERRVAVWVEAARRAAE